MSLERIKQTRLYTVVFVAAVSVAATYSAVNVLIIGPIRDNLARQDKQVTELKAQLEVSHSSSLPAEDIANLSTQLDATKTTLAEKEKLIHDLRTQLKKREDELKKEKLAIEKERNQLSHERASIDNIRLAQSLMEKYLKECAHVDLHIELNENSDAQYRKDYHRTTSILDALEAVALRISDDNEYLDFFARQRGGAGGGG